MSQSIYSVGSGYGMGPVSGRSGEIQSFRGIMIGVALSALLWAPLGLLAMRVL